MTRINRERIELQTPAGDVIRGDVRFAGRSALRPIVIVCHSFMSFKDWGFFPYVGERLVAAGYVSFVFNFSHNGVSGDSVRITEFKRFEENTYSQEIDDLAEVLRTVRGGRMSEFGGDAQRIALLGHSRGGAIAILSAASDAGIGALVTWSAIASLDRWTPHQKRMWRDRGFLPLARDTTVSPLRLGLGLLRDLEEHPGKLDVGAAASRVRSPWLILHGKEDVTVPLSEAEHLFTAAGKATTEFVAMDHVGHLYRAASRSEDNYRMLDQVLDITGRWYDKQFTH